MNFIQEHLAGKVDFRAFYEGEGVRFRGADVFCPFHEDKTPSLSIDLKTGLFRCHAGGCGASGDPVSYLERKRGISGAEAIAELRRRYSVGGNGSSARPVASSPATSPRIAATKTYEIRNTEGELVALHKRTDFDGGGKTFSWARPDGSVGLGGQPLADVPLYGSENIAGWNAEEPVLITEGEKSADAVTARGYRSLATVTGASGAPAANVLQVLRGRHTVLWPDHDDPGRAHMAKVRDRLTEIAASVRVLKWGEQKGDDAADFFARGGTEEQLDRLLAEAAASSEPLEPRKEREPAFRTLLDLERNPPPPVRYIVAYLLAEATLNLLFGKAFGGKSLFALMLALHAAAMLEFLGFTFPRPLRVLYLDEEMGVSLLSSRIEKMKSGRPEFRNPDVLQRVGFFSRAGLRLDDEKKLEFMRRNVGEFPGGVPDLILMDTLRRMHRGEEKDSGEMAKLMDTCSSLVDEFKTTLVPIHHSKKGPNDDEGDWREAARGSGDLIAASQTVIALWKSSDLLFSMRADVKASGEIQPFPMTLDPTTLLYRRQSDEERIDSAEKQRHDALEQARAAVHKLLRKLKERGTGYPPSLTTIEKAAGVNVRTAREAVRCLVEDRELCKARRRGQGGGFVYVYPEDLSEAGTPSDAEEMN